MSVKRIYLLLFFFMCAAWVSNTLQTSCGPANVSPVNGFNVFFAPVSLFGGLILGVSGVADLCLLCLALMGGFTAGAMINPPTTEFILTVGGIIIGLVIRKIFVKKTLLSWW